MYADKILTTSGEFFVNDNTDISGTLTVQKDVSINGNLHVTGNVTGSAAEVQVSTNNATNETVYLTFVDGQSGSKTIETDSGLNYNPSTGVLTTTSVTGNLTGNVTGNVSGTAATVTGAAQTAITSVGTLTTLQVDNLNLNENTISSSSGDVNINPPTGSAIVLDSTINVDEGVIIGATSITSTAFVGGLTGDVIGNVTNVRNIYIYYSRCKWLLLTVTTMQHNQL